MEKLGFFSSIYLLFGIPVAIGWSLVWLVFRKRIRILFADWLLLVVPWLVWIGLTAINDMDKSLSNLVEAFVLGCITVVFFALRSVLALTKPERQSRWAWSALLGSCFAAAALWAFVPGLPE
jgi:hypothetical protein